MSAKKFMTRDVITTVMTTSIADALFTMCQHRIHNLPVVDHKGVFVGIFGIQHLLHELLPVAVIIKSRLMGLSFVSDNPQ